MKSVQELFLSLAFRFLPHGKRRELADRAAIEAVLTYKLVTGKTKLEVKEICGIKAIFARGFPYASGGSVRIDLLPTNNPAQQSNELLTVQLTAMLGRKFGSRVSHRVTWDAVNDEISALSMAACLSEGPDDPSGCFMLELHRSKTKRMVNANRRAIKLMSEQIYLHGSLPARIIAYVCENAAMLPFEDEL